MDSAGTEDYTSDNVDFDFDGITDTETQPTDNSDEEDDDDWLYKWIHEARILDADLETLPGPPIEPQGNTRLNESALEPMPGSPASLGPGFEARQESPPNTFPNGGNAAAATTAAATCSFAVRPPRRDIHHAEKGFCAKCLHEGCNNVMYSKKKGKAVDNLLQQHQRKKHAAWVQGKTVKERCTVEHVPIKLADAIRRFD
ncbi:uncharacterized protein DFL_000713 [Arthrobotrys flagrans]|uniref:Uncharacterized protein n=1 Tax=Arthrobotrys flagrans TaxID=97331 RepID=A0A437AF02_ARTFL|nr:hypothetical protein DFL_000713 [Arthrobotrys flagrans]